MRDISGEPHLEFDVVLVLNYHLLHCVVPHGHLLYERKTEGAIRTYNEAKGSNSDVLEV